MNDFSKEELEDLSYALEMACLGNSPLRHKILELIDLYDAKVIECWHCEKCGHVQ